MSALVALLISIAPPCMPYELRQCCLMIDDVWGPTVLVRSPSGHYETGSIDQCRSVEPGPSS